MTRSTQNILRYFAFVASLVAVSGHLLRLQDSTAERWEAPWFCHGLDCPEDDVVSTTNEYEVRDYKTCTWVYANTTGFRYEIAVTKGFTTLYRYISGHNEDKEKLNMTTPVATMLLPDKDFTGVSENFTVWFYLPHEYQKEEEPPRPIAENVGLNRVPGEKHFVRSFEGFATQGTISREAAQLRDTVRANDEKFDDTAIWFLSYDPPTRLTGRHNEVTFGRSKPEFLSEAVSVARSVVKAV